MPVIKTKKKAVPKKAAQKTKKVSRALVVKPQAKKTKPARNTLEYYQCMCHQAKQGIAPKRITQVTHECKTNALAINAKMSATQKKAAQKIKVGYKTLGEGLSEFLKA
jgi:glycerol-3-phosphate responsive antiterminator